MFAHNGTIHIQTTLIKMYNYVRLGGILSLRLFVLYVNQLTDKLISCINDKCINHVM